MWPQTGQTARNGAGNSGGGRVFADIDGSIIGDGWDQVDLESGRVAAQHTLRNDREVGRWERTAQGRCRMHLPKRRTGAIELRYCGGNGGRTSIGLKSATTGTGAPGRRAGTRRNVARPSGARRLRQRLLPNACRCPRRRRFRIELRFSSVEYTAMRPNLQTCGNSAKSRQSAHHAPNQLPIMPSLSAWNAVDEHRDGSCCARFVPSGRVPTRISRADSAPVDAAPRWPHLATASTIPQELPVGKEPEHVREAAPRSRKAAAFCSEDRAAAPAKAAAQRVPSSGHSLCGRSRPGGGGSNRSGTSDPRIALLALGCFA